MAATNEGINVHPDTLALLVENHRRFLAFVERRVASRDEAEEILQAAFAKGVEKIDALKSEDSVVAWFYRLLRNAIIDHQRHMAAERRALEVERARAVDEGHFDVELEREVCRCVDDLLNTLKPEYASILREVDRGERSVGEVARELGITRENARVRLHRARKTLRRQLELSCGTCAEHGCLDCTCRREAEAGSCRPRSQV